MSTINSEQGQRERVVELFADLLDYPKAELADKTDECAAIAGALAPRADDLLRDFRDFVDATPLGRLEEIYSGFFDLTPLCHPYIGYQLFGENYKRSSFLLELARRYHAEQFQPTPREMADRLSTVLRFVAHSKDARDTHELVREGVLPALKRMTTRPETRKHDHDEQPEFDGDTGVDRRQLDGHSHGEVLGGGFLLELDAAADAAAPGDKRAHPYHQALQALRIVLQQAWPAEESSP